MCMRRQQDTMIRTSLEEKRTIKSVALISNEEVKSWALSLTCKTDPIQDLDMATGCRVDDRGDRQQWHAFASFIPGRSWSGTGTRSDSFPGIIRAIHKLAAYSIQVEAS